MMGMHGSVVRVVAMLLWTTAATAQWVVDLEAPPGGFYHPDDALSFLVPADTPVETLQRLSLEVDGIDVTAFITREEERAVYRPPQPLAYGNHELRLVEYLPDGSIVEHALYTVDVRKSAAFREADLAANVDVAASRRVADGHFSSTVSRDQQQGGLGMEGRLANADWQTRAALGLIYDSQVGNTANGRRLDMANGLVEASQGAVALRAGDHVIPGTGFVLDSFSRRGMSGSLRLDSLRSEITGFAMRTEGVNGFTPWPGVSRKQARTDGVVWTTAPLARQPERLQISATFLDGEGTSVGSSTVGATDVISGTAGSLVVDSRTWDRRVRLRGEYARSRSDADASGSTLDAVSDNAYGLLASYNHVQREVRGAAFNWNAGVEHKRIGSWFYSLGNPALPTDKQFSQAFAGFSWGGWSLNTTLARETDNVADDPRVPRTRSDYLSLGSVYTPAVTGEATGVMRLFAQPTLSLYVQHGGREFETVPATYVGDPVDDRTDTVSAGLQFVPGSWTWDIRQTRTWFDDAGNISADYNSDLTELGFELPLSEHVQISPRLQYERFSDQDSDVLTQTLLGQFGIRTQAMQDRLSTDLSYTLNRSWTDGTPETTSYTVSATAAWVVLPARARRAGVSVFATGSYLDDGAIYQVFAGLRIGWQPTY